MGVVLQISNKFMHWEYMVMHGFSMGMLIFLALGLMPTLGTRRNDVLSTGDVEECLCLMARV